MYPHPADIVNGNPSVITGVSSTAVIAAQSGYRLYLTSITLSNSDASVATVVTLTDGDGGSTVFQTYIPAANPGITLALPTPIRLTKGNGLYAVCGTTSAEVRVSVQGYRSID